jgi:hypothetical protein
MTGTLGREKPRLQTKDPYERWTEKNTLGFDAIRFAEDFLELKLLPWQKYFLIRVLATDLSGDFLYRQILLLVGRQSGKTTLLRVIVLYLMFIGRREGKHRIPMGLVLGAAQNVGIANETWENVIAMAQGDAELSSEIAQVRRANGSQVLNLKNGSRYQVTATTRGAGRGLSVDLLLLDELREQRDWLAWNALTSTTLARPHALTLATSNAGDDESVVLNTLRESALNGTDPTLCIMEWSAPPGADINDPEMWAYGVPAMGHTITESAVRGMLASSTPNGFRTEVMCQRVDALDSLVSTEAWAGCEDSEFTSLKDARGRVMLCIDVSPDLSHVTLCAATTASSSTYKATSIEAWSDIETARKELPDLIASINPHSIAWYPGGPAAAIGADLSKLKGTRVVEIKGADVPAACQGLVGLVSSKRMIHPDDSLLTAHVTSATKLAAGDGFRFGRKGGPCDAAYALAGALHLARTVQVVGKPRIIVAA